MFDEFLLWKQWRANVLSYFLDERTIQLMSGASLIFSAPREQWIRVFEPLKCSAESYQSDFVEIMVSVYLAFAHSTRYVVDIVEVRCFHLCCRSYACWVWFQGDGMC
jgi:hypothetical protein